MATVIQTYILDQLIAQTSAGTTLQELRTLQLQGLPFDCPQCDTTGIITAGNAPDGTPITNPCPLCGGMGKTAVQYFKTCVQYDYVTNNPIQ